MTILPVGSGQTYSTPEGAIAAIPAIWIDDYTILLKDIAEYVYTAGGVTNIQISGFTRVTFSLYMYPDTGKCFKDNFVIGTDAIKYNSAKGACLRGTGAYSTLFVINQAFVFISDLMLKADGCQGTFGVNSGDNCTIERCILDDNFAQNQWSHYLYGNTLTVQNILIFQRTTGNKGVLTGGGGGTPKFRFISVIRDSGAAASGNAFDFSYNGTLVNCVEYNHSAAVSGSFGAGSGNNASKQASGMPGSNNVYNITSAAWNNITAAALDLTVPSGSVLAGAGIAVAGVTTDLLGRTRANPPTIGALEVQSGGASATSYNMGTLRRIMNTSILVR